MRAKLILRVLQSLQGILQTCDFYRDGWKGKEVRDGDEWNGTFISCKY